MADFLKPEKIIEHLKLANGAKVADFGAGSGFFTLSLAKIVGPNGRVIALDVQKDTLDFIKRQAELENLTNIEIVWADLELTEGSRLQTNSQDAVVISSILFQVENKQAILNEARRVLKPGGKLLFLEWDESEPPPGPPKHLRIPKQTALGYCENTGLVLVEELPSGNHHYGFLFKK